MQLNVAEFEQLVRARCREIAQELDQLREEHRTFKSMFTDLERSYTERGKALEEASKGIKLEQWIDVKDLYFQIGYTDTGAIMGGLKFTAGSGADRVRFYCGGQNALKGSVGTALDTSSGQPEGR